MHLAHTELRENVAQCLKSLFKVFKVNFLAFLDQREHDVDLPPEMNLLANALIKACHLCVELMDGLDGFATRRELVDDADIKVAIYGHSERAGNRSCSHYEHVGRIVVLPP